MNRYISGLKVLLSATFILSTVEQSGSMMFPLHYSAAWVDVEAVKVLAKRENVNAIDGLGKAPLHLAVWSGIFVRNSWRRIEIVKMLLDNKANVDVRDAWGNTPLHLAVRQGDIGVVTYLVDCGAEVNSLNIRLQSPLNIAIDYDRKKIYDFLDSCDAVVAPAIQQWQRLEITDFFV